MVGKQRMAAAAIFLGASLLGGCSKKQVQEAVQTGVDQATHVVEQSVETVKQETNQVGSMELTTLPPVAAKACYAKLIVVGDGRPNVFQLASYKEADLERYPSMFLQAQVDATELAQLVGKTVEGKFYAQLAADGDVLETPEGSLASVRIATVDETSITCECTGVELVNCTTGERKTVGGKFVGLLQ
ncbi:MAG: hypothetical protein KDA41_12955 [Planctomycetales bacterium]|nr:hypothetical protein [Planctomycetales bacterium]